MSTTGDSGRYPSRRMARLAEQSTTVPEDTIRTMPDQEEFAATTGQLGAQPVGPPQTPSQQFPSRRRTAQRPSAPGSEPLTDASYLAGVPSSDPAGVPGVPTPTNPGTPGSGEFPPATAVPSVVPGLPPRRSVQPPAMAAPRPPSEAVEESTALMNAADFDQPPVQAPVRRSIVQPQAQMPQAETETPLRDFKSVFEPIEGLETTPVTAAKKGGKPPRAKVGFVRGTIGVIGELLITAGTVLLLFVVWQLFITDLIADRDQDAMVNALDNSAGWVKPAKDGDGYVIGTKHTEAPSSEGLAPAEGEKYADLIVPRFGADYRKPIAQGTDKSTVLDVIGLGHYTDPKENSIQPGEVGNYSLAGHRVTYGKPLNKIAELQVNDKIIVETPSRYYVYKVYGSDVVDPPDVWTVAPDPQNPTVAQAKATRRLVTLTSCHPMFSARERFIVWGELEYWTPKSEGIAPDMAANANGGQ